MKTHAIATSDALTVARIVCRTRERDEQTASIECFGDWHRTMLLGNEGDRVGSQVVLAAFADDGEWDAVARVLAHIERQLGASLDRTPLEQLRSSPTRASVKATVRRTMAREKRAS